MQSSHASQVWLRGAMTAADLNRLDQIGEGASGPGGRVDWTDPAIADALAPVTATLRSHALPNATLVRVVWFTKDSQSNWGVPWHQDRVIAVAEKHAVSGFGNWSQKRGVWHCEPSTEVFAQMRFVRVHLDDCDAANGAMEIAVGSEGEGVVADGRAAEIASRYPAEVGKAQRGDIQILPMLILHRSRPSLSPAPRRTLRLDYALGTLPHPLAWRVA
jgi:Phytanoyl-CoA dioxygenase (PhyH)